MSKEKQGSKRVSDLLDSKYPQVQLFEYLHTINTLICEKCDYEDSYIGEPVDIIDNFFNDGWKLIGDKILCPKCCIKEKK